MKKILIALVVTSVLGLSSGYARTEPVDSNIKVTETILQSFKKAFPNAEYVRWYRNGDYYVATFNNDMQRLSVYFDESGSIYSTTRFIKTEAVPINALRALEQKYDLQETDIAAMEVSKEARTYYLFSFTKEKVYHIIESDASGNMKLVKKQKVG
jgi:hypothetical protein